MRKIYGFLVSKKNNIQDVTDVVDVLEKIKIYFDYIYQPGYKRYKQSFINPSGNIKIEFINDNEKYNDFTICFHDEIEEFNNKIPNKKIIFTKTHSHDDRKVIEGILKMFCHVKYDFYYMTEFDDEIQWKKYEDYCKEFVKWE